MFCDILEGNGVRTSDVSPTSNEPARVALAVADTRPASESRHIGPSVPTSSVAAIDGNSGNRREVGRDIVRHRLAARQTSQTTEVTIPEFLAGNHLLTRLIFQGEH